MAKKTKTTTKKAAEKSVVKYTKEMLISSKRFEDKKDILNAILLENESYSIDEVNEKIKKFMKGKVM